MECCQITSTIISLVLKVYIAEIYVVQHAGVIDKSGGRQIEGEKWFNTKGHCFGILSQLILEMLNRYRIFLKFTKFIYLITIRIWKPLLVGKTGVTFVTVVIVPYFIFFIYSLIIILSTFILICLTHIAIVV